MKVVVNIPLKPTREYLEEFDETTIPDVNDEFDDIYVIEKKVINGNICILDLRRKEMVIE